MYSYDETTNRIIKNKHNNNNKVYGYIEEKILA